MPCPICPPSGPCPICLPAAGPARLPKRKAAPRYVIKASAPVPLASIMPKTTTKAIPAARQTVDAVREAPATRQAACAIPAATLAVRSATARNAHGVAAGLIVGMAGGPLATLRIQALALIDDSSARRGYITASDAAMRNQIRAAAVADLGFDPETQDGPAMPIELTRAVKTLPAPVAPLVAGDWEGLGALVKRGALTDADAVAIGQIWSGYMTKDAKA